MEKHVMLSYQWDAQKHVKRIARDLIAIGFKVGASHCDGFLWSSSKCNIGLDGCSWGYARRYQRQVSGRGVFQCLTPRCSMANAVANSSVVVCFMTNAYEDSGSHHNLVNC